MKKFFIVTLLSSLALTSCWGGTDEKKDLAPDELPTAKVESGSSKIELSSGSISIKEGTGTADVSTDESLKEIDEIINSIADEK